MWYNNNNKITFIAHKSFETNREAYQEKISGNVKIHNQYSSCKQVRQGTRSYKIMTQTNSTLH